MPIGSVEELDTLIRNNLQGMQQQLHLAEGQRAVNGVVWGVVVGMLAILLRSVVLASSRLSFVTMSCALILYFYHHMQQSMYLQIMRELEAILYQIAAVERIEPPVISSTQAFARYQTINEILKQYIGLIGNFNEKIARQAQNSAWNASRFILHPRFLPLRELGINSHLNRVCYNWPQIYIEIVDKIEGQLQVVNAPVLA